MARDLGHSLLLEDGDLVLRDGSLVETSGVRNLAQALGLRVLTPLGSDQFNTGYGFDGRSVFAEAADARMVRELVRLNLVRALGTDPRVREIREIVFLDPGDARRHRSWTVEVSLVTADDQQETLRLRPGA